MGDTDSHVLDELARLRRHAHEQGLSLQEVVGDGACAFRAVSDQLYGEESHHLELRHSTVQWLGSNHHAMYSPLFDQSRPDNIPAYLARLSNPRSFAEIGDLHGLAWAEGIHIQVLTLEDVVELGPDDGSAPTITIACALSAQHYYSCRPLAVPQDPFVHVAEQTDEGGEENTTTTISEDATAAYENLPAMSVSFELYQLVERRLLEDDPLHNELNILDDNKFYTALNLLRQTWAGSVTMCNEKMADVLRGRIVSVLDTGLRDVNIKPRFRWAANHLSLDDHLHMLLLGLNTHALQMLGAPEDQPPSPSAVNLLPEAHSDPLWGAYLRHVGHLADIYAGSASGFEVKKSQAGLTGFARRAWEYESLTFNPNSTARGANSTFNKNAREAVKNGEVTVDDVRLRSSWRVDAGALPPRRSALGTVCRFLAVYVEGLLHYWVPTFVIGSGAAIWSQSPPLLAGTNNWSPWTQDIPELRPANTIRLETDLGDPAAAEHAEHVRQQGLVYAARHRQKQQQAMAEDPDLATAKREERKTYNQAYHAEKASKLTDAEIQARRDAAKVDKLDADQLLEKRARDNNYNALRKAQPDVKKRAREVENKRNAKRQERQEGNSRPPRRTAQDARPAEVRSRAARRAITVALKNGKCSIRRRVKDAKTKSVKRKAETDLERFETDEITLRKDLATEAMLMDDLDTEERQARVAVNEARNAVPTAARDLDHARRLQEERTARLAAARLRKEEARDKRHSLLAEQAVGEAGNDLRDANETVERATTQVHEARQSLERAESHLEDMLASHDRQLRDETERIRQVARTLGFTFKCLKDPVASKNAKADTEDEDDTEDQDE